MDPPGLDQPQDALVHGHHPSWLEEAMTLSNWNALDSRIMLRTAGLTVMTSKAGDLRAVLRLEKLLGDHALQHQSQLGADLLLLGRGKASRCGPPCWPPRWCGGWR